MKIQVNLQQELVEIDASRQAGQVLLEWNGQNYVVDVVKQTALETIVQVNGRFIRIAGTKSGKDRQIWVNGRIARYQRVMAGSEEDDDEADGALAASIPAVVVDVLVAEGDRVEAGDQLILLESMKMVIPIVANKAGTVSEMRCAVGDAVQPGIPLVTIDE